MRTRNSKREERGETQRRKTKGDEREEKNERTKKEGNMGGIDKKGA